NTVRRRLHHGIEIGFRQPRAEPIYAHVQAWTGALAQGRGKEGKGMIARLLFGLRRDGIFQVKDEAIGAAPKTFRELFFAVGGNEKQGTHETPLWGQKIRFFIKAWRRHSATSLSSCW